ncbi:MAG: methionyl-tRNA formyltransferase [Phycisphaerales bacterium JB038]
MRLVFFGSGEFGLPTLQHLADRHELAAVVTQPDKPAGRGKKLAPTPIGAWAAEAGLPLRKPESVNTPEVRGEIRGLGAEAFVVIAFGQKLKKRLLEGVFAINLHASLLPRWRGAAPIHHALLAGDRETGNSVIALASRMDAGEIYAQSRRTVDPAWTAGELHDLLAQEGPALVEQVLADFAGDALQPRTQDESQVTLASRLSKGDGWVSFEGDAREAVQRINGLSPWPAVTATLGDLPLKLLRAKALAGDAEQSAEPGALDAEGRVACGTGRVQLLEVQPAGKRAMSFADFVRGHTLAPDACLRSNPPC